MNEAIREIPDGPTLIQAERLAGSVIHAFSTRQGGVSRGPFATLNLGQSVGDDPAAVQENRRRFFGRFDLELDRVVRVKQVHGDQVLVVDAPLARRPGFPSMLIEEPARYDAMITNLAGFALVVSTADCVPILIHDRVTEVIAAVHAGWRGTARRIAAKALAAMEAVYDVSPLNCHVAIGPAIQQCCYEVDQPVKEVLAAAVVGDPGLVRSRPGHWLADLPGANRDILHEAGVPLENIENIGLCTACRPDLFFSHRRDRGRTGRMMNFILVLPTS
ncbi:MAG TPA: peptidoglycan editing factor PgeF, partial [Candidatus Sulfotelmatobacter sp.]|nr:peptidoglycan editing factor PgeF [Candidatus Sulfotelmatobacter sp.]